MFITGYASRFHGNLLLRSEALASVVALYAGKVRVACTIQMHDDLKKLLFDLCHYGNYMCYPMFSGRSGSRLFP